MLGDGVNIAARGRAAWRTPAGSASPGRSSGSGCATRSTRRSNAVCGRPALKNIRRTAIDVYRVVPPWTGAAAHVGRQPARGPATHGSVRAGAIAALVGARRGAAGMVAGRRACRAKPSARPSESAPLPRGRPVAVLPFVNMSSDKENEYFSDGITEDLITALSKVSGSHVAARDVVVRVSRA